jgi:hypothetical protein
MFKSLKQKLAMLGGEVQIYSQRSFVILWMTIKQLQLKPDFFFDSIKFKLKELTNQSRF